MNYFANHGAKRHEQEDGDPEIQKDRDWGVRKANNDRQH